jgi:hypothetical protein
MKCNEFNGAVLRVKPVIARVSLLLASYRIGRSARIASEEIERILHDGLRPAKGMPGGDK